MKYAKPEVKKVEIPVEISTEASETTSCDGGHCVRTRYGQDH